MPEVLVPAERVERWVVNVAGRHGEAVLAVVDGQLRGTAADDTTFALRLPFAAAYAGPPDPAAFAAAVTEAVPTEWGLLLVRKGGFAVARCAGPAIAGSKVGQRHVQGRSKAGGQSQQRFARRRDNQAREAYRAAADHAARLLVGPLPLIVGGDRAAVTEVLADTRLRGLTPGGPWLAVPDPRRDVLEQAVRDACAARAEITEP